MRLCVAALVSLLLANLGEYPTWRPPTCAEDVVVGELYAIASEQVAALDEIEGFRGFGVAGSLFRRIILERAPGRFCWTYLAAAAGGTPIPSGDWRRR